MLWLKAFHIIFIVTWFAGLFYLPRLLVYHAEAGEQLVRDRFKIMERKLLVMTHIGGGLGLGFGLALLVWWQTHVDSFLQVSHWLHLKLLMVVGLVIYHFMLVRLTRQFARDDIRRSSRWLRIFNEIPAVLLIGIVLLVVLKPF